MSVPTISPEQARRLLAEGATLIDLRQPDEHADFELETDEAAGDQTHTVDLRNHVGEGGEYRGQHAYRSIGSALPRLPLLLPPPPQGASHRTSSSRKRNPSLLRIH